MKQLKNTLRQGFTLIELLVVVAIIGILIVAGMVAFTNAQKNSRDARRQSDLRSMQNAFEQYYGENANTYAETCAGMADSFPGNALPTDPRGNVAYTCTPTGVAGAPPTATGYCICAQVEQVAKGNSTDTNCSFATPGSGTDYFCVTERQ